VIVPGTAIVNASTGKIELIPPLGFGTARGIRLSNYNTDTLTLTDISGTSQSQEYLPPQTQMVYATDNVGRTPTIIGQTLTSATLVTNILVEWSTDPAADFIGTYPVGLPQSTFTPPSVLTKIGDLNTNNSRTYDVTVWKTIWLYIHNTGVSGGQIFVTWQTSVGVNLGATLLGGVGASSTSQGATSGWVSFPVLGPEFIISGAATTSAAIYGSLEPTDGITGYPDGFPLVTGTKTVGTGVTSSSIVSCFGPCQMDYTASIQDATTKGFFGFNGSTFGFADTSNMATDSQGLLTIRGTIITPPGLNRIAFNQLSATTGGNITFSYNLTPYK
jgi:hypothetical protein